MLNDMLQDIANDKNKFSLANFLTLSRILFLPFILYHLTRGTIEHDRWAAFFMLLAGSTDFFDGYVARKYNQISYLGKLLDPVIDKISIGTVMVFLTLYNELPLWYVVIVIGRDIFILGGGMYVMASKSFIVQSNNLGKWTVTSFVAVILAFTLHLHLLTRICMWISLILIPVSAVVYVVRYIRNYKYNHLVKY